MAPEPGTKAYAKKPFSGKKVLQSLPDGKQIAGRLLVGQCQGMTTRNRRCRQLTAHDYQFCTLHLAREWGLMVAPSRIPGAGLGVFAVNERLLGTAGKDAQGRPLPCNTCVVFEKGDSMGNGFGGEWLSEEDEIKRYGEGGSSYILTWYIKKNVDGPGMIDGFLARTVSSYCNDGNNVRKCANWPFRNNAAWEGKELTADTLICHGDEILWSYGAGYWNGRFSPTDSPSLPEPDSSRGAPPGDP